MPSRRRMRRFAPGPVALPTAARMRRLSSALNLRRFAFSACGHLRIGESLVRPVPRGSVESSWRSRSDSLRSPTRSRQTTPPPARAHRQLVSAYVSQDEQTTARRTRAPLLLPPVDGLQRVQRRSLGEVAWSVHPDLENSRLQSRKAIHREDY